MPSFTTRARRREHDLSRSSQVHPERDSMHQRSRGSNGTILCPALLSASPPVVSAVCCDCKPPPTAGRTKNSGHSRTDGRDVAVGMAVRWHRSEKSAWRRAGGQRSRRGAWLFPDKVSHLPSRCRLLARTIDSSSPSYTTLIFLVFFFGDRSKKLRDSRGREACDGKETRVHDPFLSDVTVTYVALRRPSRSMPDLEDPLVLGGSPKRTSRARSRAGSGRSRDIRKVLNPEPFRRDGWPLPCATPASVTNSGPSSRPVRRRSHKVLTFLRGRPEARLAKAPPDFQ
ncbi:hypothetical protein HPB51_021244 [Rhipicephalus microplus]|uniref:Uncharacterized protein n=1 Tax=Rhipicephalus microplus TaxID=6941 RepID=A0A9J6F996_RHIMP|nr:hypothetical protein HPB51_021244 [Rhipicephalus microplus]